MNTINKIMIQMTNPKPGQPSRPGTGQPSRPRPEPPTRPKPDEPERPDIGREKEEPTEKQPNDDPATRPSK